MRKAILTLLVSSSTIVSVAVYSSAEETGRPAAAPLRTSVSLRTRPAEPNLPCLTAAKNPLPLPTAVPPATFVAFEKRILAFLQNGEYKQWCVDKGVRDTGPYRNGVYYGTHPAVRVFYSPEYMQWLAQGRMGAVPDGAMVIKEQYPPPAARYDGMSSDQLPPVNDWTIMIRNASGSKDGWFWGEFFTTMTFDDDQPPFNYPWAGFGLYCIRCHSTATQQYTFGDTNNIAGFPGMPKTYDNDGTWRGRPLPDASVHTRLAAHVLKDPPPPDPDFLQVFNSIPRVDLDQVQKLTPETFDHLPAPPGAPNSFVNSSQCISCHGALNNKSPFGPTMFLPSQPQPSDPTVVAGANVSPYTEWRWSPMGLAGRDPIFFAQLESELAFVSTLPPPSDTTTATAVRNACMSCHGAMGQRQLVADNNGTGDFLLEYLQITDRSDPKFKYGALARDGISCTICHRIAPDQAPPGVSPLQHFLQNSTTGQFPVTPPSQLSGPYPDNQVATAAMENAIGLKPQQSSYLQSSRVCGTCHTIDLPIADQGKLALHSIEQSTYLEWLNSQYQNEFGPAGPNAKTCQGCHMPGEFHNPNKGLRVPDLKQKIAIIQDETYPASSFQLPVDQVTVTPKENSRHSFLGLNIFLLEMFNQFAEVLGVNSDDYMSSSTTTLQDTIDNFAQQAQETTATVGVTARAPIRNGAHDEIVAEVNVTNLVGHRFPSGVGFRRAFLEVLVVQNNGGQEKVVWSSGQTNRLGLIVDGNGTVLPSEFFTTYIDSQGRTQQAFQEHYQLITSGTQVQIYEELTQNVDGKFTTSFIRRDATVKDNRLLPIGWKKDGPDPSLDGRYLKATQPDGQALMDPDYQNGQGVDRITYQITLPTGVNAADCEVRVTLYHQSIPPYYLRDRFSQVPNGDATKRLHYMGSRLALDGTNMENWKLKIASAVSPVR